MSKVEEFLDLVKGRKAYPEGTKSKDGKRIKRAGKWVLVKTTRKPATPKVPDALAKEKAKLKDLKSRLKAAMAASIHYRDLPMGERSKFLTRLELHKVSLELRDLPTQIATQQTKIRKMNVGKQAVVSKTPSPADAVRRRAKNKVALFEERVEEAKREKGSMYGGDEWVAALERSLNIAKEELSAIENLPSVSREKRTTMAEFFETNRHPRFTQPELQKMDFQIVKLPESNVYGCVALALATYKAKKAPLKAQYHRSIDNVLTTVGDRVSWTRRRFQNQPTRNFGVYLEDVLPLYKSEGLDYTETRVGDTSFPRNCILRMKGNKGYHVAARIDGVVRDGYDVRSDPRHYQILGYYTEKKKKGKK